MLTKSRVACAAFITVIFTVLAVAGVPQTINFQGYLTDNAGVPVTASAKTVGFALYSSSAGTTPLWNENQDVRIDRGIYSVQLGASTPLTLPFDKQYYFGITIPPDPEMSPRQMLANAPYAKNISMGCSEGGVLIYRSGSWKCGTVTTLPNAAATCVGSDCIISMCSPGWGNCNSLVPDGCEANLSTSPANCGYCGNSCNSGSCGSGVCLYAQGAVCSNGSECASGFCADGVCCQSACAGSCEKCNQAGRLGFCDAIPASTDPDSECTAQSVATCGTNGLCSGSRSCAFYTTGTVAIPASCTSSTYTSPDTCNGLGSVIPGGSVSCSPYVCGVSTCKSSCVSNADCVSGYTCNGANECKKSTGSTCFINSECSSGFCADGVCCQSACAGSCEKCNQAGRQGFCDPISAGTDPDNECAAQSVASCGTNGFCSGSRSCAFYTSGTVAIPANCTSNTYTGPGTCNGLGSVVSGGSVSCSPYVCGTSTCKTSCVSNADCISGYSCSAGNMCKKSTGSICSINSECTSGFCTDGVCCESACLGSCEKCSQSGRQGFCDAIPLGTDPDNECTLACNGARACQ